MRIKLMNPAVDLKDHTLKEIYDNNYQYMLQELERTYKRNEKIVEFLRGEKAELVAFRSRLDARIKGDKK